MVNPYPLLAGHVSYPFHTKKGNEAEQSDKSGARDQERKGHQHCESRGESPYYHIFLFHQHAVCIHPQRYKNYYYLCLIAFS